MDPILERFNRLIKSMFVDTDDIDFGNDNFSGSSDSDFADARDELNDFLASPGESTRSKTRHNSRAAYIPDPPEMLRHDYDNLGVPFGTDFNITKKEGRVIEILCKTNGTNKNPRSKLRGILTRRIKKLQRLSSSAKRRLRAI